jgi:tetratricopeptide (TPR) repeat protein
MKAHMKTQQFTRIAAIMLAAVSMPAAAQLGVTFIDGGYAELCSDVAKTQDAEKRVELTGSRLGASPIEICTMAINFGESSLFEIAASYNNRGVLYFEKAQMTEALRDFEEAISVHDSLGQAHINRGYVLVGMQRWADSVAAFDKGIALGGEELDKAYFNRGVAHEELGQLREAYKDYLKASELNPVWEDPKRELARFTVKKPK